MTRVTNSRTRQKVIPAGAKSVRSMLFGLYVYGGKVGITTATQKHPNTVKLLAAFAHEHWPTFNFSSIQLNMNVKAKPHVDPHNLGPSMIIGLGNYRGGELFVHDE